MAARFKVLRSYFTGPEKAGNSNEANPVAIQKLLRLEPTNGQPDRTNRKRKLEAIYIDGDIDEMVGRSNVHEVRVFFDTLKFAWDSITACFVQRKRMRCCKLGLHEWRKIQKGVWNESPIGVNGNFHREWCPKGKLSKKNRPRSSKCSFVFVIIILIQNV